MIKLHWKTVIEDNYSVIVENYMCLMGRALMTQTIYLLAEYFVGVPSGFSAVVSLAEGGGGMANAVVCCAAPPVALFVDDG